MQNHLPVTVISSQTSTLDFTIVPNLIDNSIVRIHFDHSQGEIDELTFKLGSNMQLINSYWGDYYYLGLERVRNASTGETGTVCTDCYVTSDSAFFHYQNALYGTKEVYLKWGSSIGFEMNTILSLTQTGPFKTGAYWEPGGTASYYDSVAVYNSQNGIQKFRPVFGQGYQLIYEGSAQAAWAWDYQYDEAFGYRNLQCPTVHLSSGAVVGGPRHLDLSGPGTYVIEFALKNKDSFLSWALPPIGNIAGTVAPTINGAGAIVNLYQNGNPVASETIAEDGTYSFNGFSVGNYTVELIEPSGYDANQNNIAVLLSQGATEIVDFYIFPIPTSQPPDIIWESTYGGSAWDRANYVLETSDNGYIMAGITESFGAGGRDFYVVRTDAVGNQLWDQTYGGNNNDHCFSIQPTTDGCFILAGLTCSFGDPNGDVYLIKIDELGNLIWERTFGGSAYDSGWIARQTTDGGYIISGWTLSFGAAMKDVYVVKTDQDGNLEWQNLYGGSNHDYGRGVCQTADGGYVIGGSTSSYGNDHQIYLLKTDSQGNMQWENNFGGAVYDISLSLELTTDGGFILSHVTSSFGVADYNMYIVKTNSFGALEWQQTFGGIGYDNSRWTIQTLDGGFISCGLTASYGAGANDVYLVKMDSQGSMDWYKTIGGVNDDMGYSILQFDCGDYLVAGETQSLGLGYGDFYLARLGIPAIISGTVTPLPVGAGCDVFLYVEGGITPIESTQTSGTGTYSFENLASGDYVIQLDEPEGYIVDQNNILVSVSAGGVAVVDFNLSISTGTISGLVTNGFAGIDVHLKSTGGTVLQTVQTLADGSYSFPDIDAGDYLVNLLEPQGYTVDQHDVAVTLTPGGTSTVNFVLTALPGTISGTVSGGFAGITMELRDTGNNLVSTTATIADGSYEFASVVHGDYTVYIIEPEGYTSTPLSVAVSLAPGGTATANFTLTANPGSISGLVTGGFAEITMELRDTGNNFVASTVTIADGYYEFSTVSHGDYTVNIVQPEGYTATPLSVAISLAPGGTATANFTLTPNLGSISGVVTDGFAGIAVDLKTPGGDPVDNTLTLEDGSYSFTDIDHGDYVVSIQVPEGYVVNQNDIPATLPPGGSVEVNFVLEALPGTISGTVANGFADITISLKNVSGEVLITTLTAEGGIYTFEQVDHGDYLVDLTEPEGYVVDQHDIPVTLPPGGTVAADFVLTALPGSLSGTLTPAFEGKLVELVDDQSAVVASTVTLEDGTYLIENIDHGDYFVDLELPLGYSVNHNHVAVAIPPGGAVVVDFELTPIPAVISGSVTPVFEGVTIDLYVAGGGLLESVATDENGAFSFPAHNPGDYVVEVVEPLGFSVDPLRRTVTLIGVDLVLDAFTLTEIPIANNARSMGYWKHQVNSNITGKGNRDYDETDLLGFTTEILDHFYWNITAPIRVEGVTYVVNAEPPYDDIELTMDDLEIMLNINQGGGSSLHERACLHFLPLLLNVVSGNLSQQEPASDDLATVSQAIIYIGGYDGLLAIGEDEECELAKEIAETLNKGQTVGEGIIPLTIPNVIFGEEIEELLPVSYEFRFDPPAPNPFNPVTRIAYELPEDSFTELSIFNIRGQVVCELVNGWREAGPHEVFFNANMLSSGVYLALLKSGDHQQLRKLVLMK
jgi:hypothetical protein